jgi:ATP-dependent Clp protease ATP-binding subunit ClpA
MPNFKPTKKKQPLLIVSLEGKSAIAEGLALDYSKKKVSEFCLTNVVVTLD